MKIKNYIFALVASVALFSCGSEKPAESTVVTTDSLAADTFSVVTDSALVNWKGNMTGVKAYSHNGSVKISEGSFTIQNGVVTGGSFTVDLKTMTPLDSNYDDKKRTKENLVGHLSTADFFATDSFPTAKFVVKSVEGNTVTGDLTIRGKTNEEKVTDVAVSANGDMVTATGKLVFDRQKYGVSYKAAMKDMALADNIELNITLVGKKQ